MSESIRDSGLIFIIFGTFDLYMKPEMKMSPSLEKVYSHEHMTALEAQRFAQEIAFAPVVFQVSRLMLEFGVLKYICENVEGVTIDQVAENTGLTKYAAKVLLEASLSIGTVLIKDGRFRISKAGWFLLNDRMVKANMKFNHDVNYLGLFHLEEALKESRPAGLKVFGEWPTIYEGLSSLPDDVRESWFGFDHFYSDESFDAALEVVFKEGHRVKRLLDVGGNTGKWALRCVGYDPEVEVTVMDLPQQLQMMRKNISGCSGEDRIHGYAADLLDESVAFPAPPYDVIWMSQFLDCFSEEEITDICRRAAESMDVHTRLYIMETFWDRQKYETAAYCLTLTSVYFTAMANGKSKMYHSDDMVGCVENAGLEIETVIDGLGMGHSIMICKKKQ